MIITPPTKLDAFGRCECNYSLLKIGNRYAIEWDNYSVPPPYAVMIDSEELAKECFDKLRKSKLSYDGLIEKVGPPPEDIIDDCPWEYTENYVAGVERRYGGDYWNSFDHPDLKVDFPIRIGPYDTFEEATQHFIGDLVIATEIMKEVTKTAK